MYNQLRNCHNKDEIIVSRPRELYDDISLLVRFYIESTNHILTSDAVKFTVNAEKMLTSVYAKNKWFVETVHSMK